jgi:hypothetical protein
VTALLDYCGAGSRLPPEKGLALDPSRWAHQPKIDGIYTRVTLDRRGRIANVLDRGGKPIREARDLIGITAGAPDSVLHAELEAHTEAGNRIAAARGWRALHLFDCTRFAGRDVRGEAYQDRYGMLHRMQAELECTGTARRKPWSVDDQGDAHDRGGRYCKQVPRDLRRLPIVPLARGASGARELWDSFVEREGGEGLVAVRLDAPAGARGAKRKIKNGGTLDATVLGVENGVAELAWRTLTFLVSARGRIAADLVPGAIVEVATDGWYESSTTPRFARIVRRRTDLEVS